MQETNMKQVVAELVGDEVRSGKVIRNADVLRVLPLLAEAIHVDKMKLKGKIRDSLLEEGTYNPLNVILGIIGFRIVSEDGMPDRVGFRPRDDSASADDMKPIDAIKPFIQNKVREEAEDMDLENVTNELNENRQELAYMRQSVAEQVQFMLADLGREQEDSAVGNGLKDILAAVDVEAVWEAEDESGMFTVLKTERLQTSKNKPCMVSGGKVLVKGLRFIAAGQE